jgi:hypothetical protein
MALCKGAKEVITYIIEKILAIDLPQLRTIEMNWALVWSPGPVKCWERVCCTYNIYQISRHVEA